MAHSRQHSSRALTQQELEARRLKACGYFHGGKPQCWICSKLGVSRAAVCQWHGKWLKEGQRGLLRKKYGRVPMLTPAQEKQLQQDILGGALKFGYTTDCWTLKRITAHIRKKTGMVYKDRSVWFVMRRFGFSCQKPERRARERDEKAIATWLADTWPKIKKGA